MKTINLNLIQELSKRAVLSKSITIYRDRAKASGYMWRGECSLELPELTFKFDLWHHGSGEETEESLEDKFSLRGIIACDNYFDASWYAIAALDGIYLHPTGWFKSEELRNTAIIKALPNRNIYSVELTDGEKAVLGGLGFKCIIQFN